MRLFRRFVKRTVRYEILCMTSLVVFETVLRQVMYYEVKVLLMTRVRVKIEN
jgi:hypothetical protein